MKAKALAFFKNTHKLIDIGISFTGDRAVVSYRSGKHPAYHTNVYYDGLFFWLRLGRACRDVWNSIEYKACKECGKPLEESHDQPNN